MGKSWKQFGEKKKPRAPRLDIEEERRACRKRVEWSEDEDEEQEGAAPESGEESS